MLNARSRVIHHDAFPTKEPASLDALSGAARQHVATATRGNFMIHLWEGAESQHGSGRAEQRSHSSRRFMNGMAARFHSHATANPEPKLRPPDDSHFALHTVSC